MENNKNKKSVKFQGDMLNFCDFIQVFVFTTNHHLNVKYGLFNGAQGEVVDIVYTNDHKPSDSFPDVVMVDFLFYTGPLNLYHLCSFQENLSADAKTASEHRYH